MVRARDESRDLPVPVVPSDPDAYELAYLRGGARERQRRHLVIGGSDKEPLIGRSDGPVLDD
jgi:hypothetical protein